jgi:hypothetical protein
VARRTRPAVGAGKGVREELAAARGEPRFVLGRRVIGVVAFEAARCDRDHGGQEEGFVDIWTRFPTDVRSVQPFVGYVPRMVRVWVVSAMVVVIGCNAAKDDANKSKATEAKVQLQKLELFARNSFAMNGALPAGTVGPTPTTPCCQQPGQRCAPNVADWNGLWQTLEFALSDPFQFQYSYQSDGSTFTATAVGDLDCSGTPVTFTLTGTIEGGKVVARMREQ